MKNLLFSLFAAAFFGSAASPQVDPGKMESHLKTQTRSGQSVSSPVTLDEMAETIQQVETAVQRVVLRNYKAVPRQKGGAGVAKTSTIVSELGRLFQLCKPKFIQTPPMQPVDAGVLSLKTGEPSRSRLVMLIKWGCVGRVSPLATSPKQSLTPEEFGDAIGLYLSRLAELTYTPSSRWSPFMNWHMAEQGGTVPAKDKKFGGG